MEILVDYGPVTEAGILGILIIAIAAFTFMIGLAGIFFEQEKIGIICLSIFIILAGISMAFQTNLYDIPTGKYKYIVEITDENKYKELIQKDYTFVRMYDNREIYTIVGDELK